MIGTGTWCNQWELLKDSNTGIYVRTDDLPPKRIYKKTEQDTYNSNVFYLVIENIRGHFGGEALRKITELVEQKCTQVGVLIPQHEWYELGRD